MKKFIEKIITKLFLSKEYAQLTNRPKMSFKKYVEGGRKINN